MSFENVSQSKFGHFYNCQGTIANNGDDHKFHLPFDHSDSDLLTNSGTAKASICLEQRVRPNKKLSEQWHDQENFPLLSVVLHILLKVLSIVSRV